MTKKQDEKVIYLVTDADKKTPLINLYALPTKCPVCNVFLEPQAIGVQYLENKDAKVQFKCVNKRCNSSFSALYMTGSYGVKEEYHFICFI